MMWNKRVNLLIFILSWVACASSAANAHAHTIDLQQSVNQALNYSPQLKALTHSHEAIAHDLEQSRARYRPSIDLSLGYGLEQYSDETTRKSGAVPADSDWDPKEDASLRLTQKVYDGGETRSHISIQEAILESSQYQIQAATQAIALNAISAHLEVYMQRELVALAEKNLKIHQDIYQLLAEREQAGAGDIADVTQTQARMARAHSDVLIKKADLSRTIATYTRATGSAPQDLAYALIPERLPTSLEEAQRWVEQKNPELLAFNANLIEAEARVALTRSPYKPKINLELSSSYNDQLEGSRTWQNTNEAMVVLRWNLYNGGQDKAGENAALSRKHQSRSNRDDKLLELRESTAAVWASFLSMQNQKKAYQDAVNYSRLTFEAYLNQFTVSKRSLLDVLIAENDYYQSSSQLIMVTVNEAIVAHRILKLGGELHISELSQTTDKSKELSRLAQAMVFPYAAQATPPEPKEQPPLTVTEHPVPIFAGEDDRKAPITESATTSPAASSLLNSMEIGPCISKQDLEQSIQILRDLGLDVQQRSGTGKVRFFRLLEGTYPQSEARKQMQYIRNLGYQAFALPDSGQLSIYVGSFRESARALNLKKQLEQKQLTVSIIESEIEMPGTLLFVQHVEQQTAEEIAKQITQKGLSVKVIGEGDQ